MREALEMNERDLFERERDVLNAANEILKDAEDTKSSWYAHYEKLLDEFNRVVNQSKRLIRLGDIMQSRLNRLKEQLQIEVENHKKTQLEKEDFQAQLFHAQKMEALGTLVGGIAHDFNNMIQAILGYSELLLMDKKKGDPGLEELQNIIRTGKGGAELVRKLLAFGQRGPTFPVSFNLNRRLIEITKLISRTFPSNVRITLNLVDSPTTVLADPVQIDQVVMNVAINASEAMPNGGRLYISTDIVPARAVNFQSNPESKPENYVALSVRDTGIGMEKEVLNKVFDPFFSTKERGAARGTGLGLSVVQGIVNQQGGYMTCDSAPEQGTEFRVFFPAIGEPPQTERALATGATPGESKPILLIEEDTAVAQLLRDTLEKEGHSVLVAGDGRQAIDIYNIKKDEISLVILDLALRQMSPHDCLMEMLYANPAMKALILSFYDPEDQSHREISPFVKGFIRKPFSVTELIEATTEVLESRRNESQ